MNGERPAPVGILYERDGEWIRFAARGMTNHELRCVLLGFWDRLGVDDRADFVAELLGYGRMPLERQPPLSQAIARGEADGEAINLLDSRYRWVPDPIDAEHAAG